MGTLHQLPILRVTQLQLPLALLAQDDGEQLRCGLCGKRYKTVRGVVQHLDNYHAVPNLEGVS